MTLDPVTLAVIQNGLRQVASEITVDPLSLMRLATTL